MNSTSFLAIFYLEVFPNLDCSPTKYTYELSQQSGIYLRPCLYLLVKSYLALTSELISDFNMTLNIS